jgi:hypothetical protein
MSIMIFIELLLIFHTFSFWINVIEDTLYFTEVQITCFICFMNK